MTKKKPEPCWNCGAEKKNHASFSGIWMNALSAFLPDNRKFTCRIAKGSKLAKRMGWE